MKIKIAYLIALVIISTFFLNSGCNPKMNIDKTISKITLEEKASLVVGTGMYFAGMEGNSEITLAEKLVSGAAGASSQIERVGITPMVLADGPAGLRINPTRPNDENTYYCTAFPIATLLASTWDTEIVYKVGTAIGNEVLEYGADILLAPALNLHRNPLCGRNFEYYSEDPLVTGKITAAMVKGVQSQNVGTSIKHFAANNQETDRFTVDTIVSERALRELYLEGFRIAVEEAQPWTVMSSYNKINGTYSCENYDLLTKVLREDWKFKGFVMTDWLAGSNVISQMKAGNDMIMPGNANQKEKIIKAVKDGTLDEEVLNLNVKRILNIILKSPHYRGYKYSNKPDLKSHAEIARKAAADGMVLLKNNNNALPFSKDIKNIAAFGNTSYEIVTGGTGSGNVNEAYSISLVEGLEKSGLSIDIALQNLYISYIENAKAKQQTDGSALSAFMLPPPIEEMNVTSNIVERMALENDIALITIGRNSGEFTDRSIENDFNLSESEKITIHNITEAFKAKGKKTVVILNIGGVIETASWKDIPDAILLAWQPGQEAGHAIADILSGKVNPSGKLADTFPINYSDIPSSKNFPGRVIESDEPMPESDSGRGGLGISERRAEVIYQEDIYVGYRYFNTFEKDVSYEFGYGMSYTTFKYSNITINSDKFRNQIKVSVDVKNTGNIPGREVVQVYLTAPKGKLDKPKEELVAFGKTKLLEPNKKETLSFVLKPRDLASFDTDSSSWIAEQGKYIVKVGASSRDIKDSLTFELDEKIIVEKDNKALSPEKETTMPEENLNSIY